MTLNYLFIDKGIKMPKIDINSILTDVRSLYSKDKKALYAMHVIMKTDCGIFDIERMMQMDALTVYNFLLNTLKKECYKVNGMKHE